MRKRNRVFIFTVLCLVFCAGCFSPAFAYDAPYTTNYGFTSGVDNDSIFGNPTGYDEPARTDPLMTNQRRNKDAAFAPPAYGTFSGDIPSDPSSPYHDNTPVDTYTQLTGMEPEGAYTLADTSVSGDFGISPSAGAAGYAGGTTGYAGEAGSYSGEGTSFIETAYPDLGGLLTPTSTSGYNTSPQYNDDGTMGTLYIEHLDKTVKVFEGENLDSMKKGLGHFETTSAWDGNVGLAGHNRGTSAYFGFIKDLNIGDKLTYTTPYGSRTYEVYRKDKIDEYDYSGLGWTVDNVLSLITCVENQRELRWIVQAAEVR